MTEEQPAARQQFVVWKFGGSSLANGARIKNVASLVLDFKEVISSSSESACLRKQDAGANLRLLVVVSAIAGITDLLKTLCKVSAEGTRCKRALPFQFAALRPSLQEKESSGERPGSPLRSMASLGYSDARDEVLEELLKKHDSCLEELLDDGWISAEAYESLSTTISNDISRRILPLLDAIAVLGYVPTYIREFVMGHGEVWSSIILTEVLRHRVKVTQDLASSEAKISDAVDARELLVTFASRDVEVVDAEKTTNAALQRHVYLNYEKSGVNMKRWLDETVSDKTEIAVATGYICQDENGRPSTLMRNGSDYSAALFSALLEASLLTIWSDVDGIYSADPRKVRSAIPLPFVTYAEAMELAYHGGSVLHPFTMRPCVKKNIPILLKSSLQPEKPGTVVAKLSSLVRNPSVSSLMERPTKRPLTAKAFSAIRNVALITLCGPQLFGMKGAARRILAGLEQAEIAVIVIIQASSEQSVGIGVLAEDSQRARTAIAEEFFREMTLDDTLQISVRLNCAILCAVGENMSGRPGELSILSAALAGANVNIIAVLQGVSENNVNFVIDEQQVDTAIYALHCGVFGA